MFTLPKRVMFFLTLCVFTLLVSFHPAFSDEPATGEIPLNPYGIRSKNPYLADRFLEDNKSIDMIIVPSRPEPPDVYEFVAAVPPEPDIAAGTNTLPNMPALTWCFGCSATSAAMMFGYYDNTGYPDMYSGPTNGGVFPMDNSAWGTTVINGEFRDLCPLSATRQGLDGRTLPGHVDDYWIKYGDVGPDPFIDNWPEHAHGDCTADFMGTNQSLVQNIDGGTTFFIYTNGAPLYDYTGAEPDRRDGCHGLRLFAESRGYTATANFSQYIYGYDGNTQGFTFDQFKDEIDAGRPVLIQVLGHTMLGYGYNDTGSIIYIHDTWNYDDHEMVWGGSYSGMQHYGVAVISLDAVGPMTPAVSTTTVSSVTQTTASSGGNVTSDGGASVTARGVCWSTSADPDIG
ncbi:MAG: hypothetical protein JRF65_15575, partial [Deltaproteobacteria bacterium]|nr:hypothetical protein [Deltaproteobacteria bacterium]